jgi:nitrate/TMAO reductase-like tetraheme cytochrome c subunit
MGASGRDDGECTVKVLVLILLVVACGDSKYSVAELQDPNTCKTCHPKHYDEWSGSMHAYASEDPVFVAMNARGQREAQLGTFCVQCHAPMAVKLGLTDGTNYDPSTLPAEAKGITCYFCHNVDKVTDDHNNGLVLAMDQTMRGGASKPADTPAHDSSYDKNLMVSSTNQSTMCGSCHDIVTPAGVHIERSYEEWKTTIFTVAGINGDTCSKCHMKPSDGVIAEGPGLNVGNRIDGFHDHGFPAIDQAVTPFPNPDVQAAGIQDILDPSIAIVGPTPVAGPPSPGGICLDPLNGGTLTVRADTFNVGHAFPSGASQDRRSWLEVIAYDASNNIVFSSGVVGDNQDPEDIDDPITNCTGTNTQANKECGGFWDRMQKTDGTRAHFFWEVATETSYLLQPATTLVSSDPKFDHSSTATWNVASVFTQIDHITATLKTRPFPYATLNELVSSGDLDASFAAKLTTLSGVGSTQTWLKATKGTGVGSMNTNCNFNN